MKTLVTLVRRNQYFFVPFIAWLAIGATLQIVFFTKEELFIGVNKVHTPFLDYLFTGLTYLGDGLAFGALLAILLVMRKFRLFFMGGITLLLVAIVVQVIKHQFEAPRPMAYFTDVSLIHTVSWVRVHKSLSFPSGHTATAFAMFCFLALVWRNKTAATALFCLSLIIGWSRIYLAQHFFEDVYIGSIIGTLSCVIAFVAFNAAQGKTSQRTTSNETEPVINTPTGLNAPI